MEKDPSNYLADSALNEFFTNNNLKISHNRKKHKNRYPAVLESLDSQNYRPMQHSQSAMSLAESPQIDSFSMLNSQPKLNNGLKPLAVKDFNRVSDLMHRVSAVSGHGPDDPALSPQPSSNAEIAANMSEYQLKAMKESNTLRETMEKVIQLHQEMESIITVHLTHRKELAKQVEGVNNKYIKLFEESLSEMLKTQRLKFKSQTQEIERMKKELDEVTAKLAAATSTIEYQGTKIIELQAMYYEVNENYSIAKAELYSLRNYKNSSERDRLEFEDRYNSAVATMQAEFDAKFFKAKVANEQEMSTLALKFAEERLRLTQKYEKAHHAHQDLLRDMAALRDKAKAFDSIRASSDLRRPLRDNSCQTNVTDNGLWDKQDGWVMPISQTARIRAMWRRGMKFAACPACRGVGKYVHKVGAILRAVKRGKELIKEMILEEDQSKWCLPDECVRFLSNLPKTAQAFRPHGLAWTVHCVYYIFALKYAVDREDDVLGYNRQPLVEFVIERYLMSTADRPDAELRMFHLIRSVKEYHRKHPLLQLFARFMGILDAVSDEEYARIMYHHLQGEAALKRKREEGLKNMGARERVKMINDAERKRELENVFHNPEHDFRITNHSLSMDILSITSYARRCMLFAPYTGAYAVHIAQAKRISHMQQTQAHQLRKPAKNTFSANAIMPAEYNAEFPELENVEHLSEKVIITDPVPLHLCIGDKSQHWVPIDRAVTVVKHLLNFLSPEQLTTVYHEMECHSMFLMENGTLDLPEGTHSLIRSTIRLFASCPVDGGFDLSWHDLYHAFADSGNQAEYSAHFIKTIAAKEVIVPVPPPIVVPIVGALPKKYAHGPGHDHPYHHAGHKNIHSAHLHPHLRDDSDDDTSPNPSASHSAVHSSDDEEEEEEDVIVRKLCYTKDPKMVFLDKSYTMVDYRHAVEQQVAVPDAEGTGWHQSDSVTTTPKGHKIVTQEDVLGNHPHLRHYHHIHPHTMMVNLDVTLQIISEAMLNKSALVSVRIRQIFVEGDTNHDGVLSFSEFLDIVKKVAPEYHERKILKMFREALSSGDDNECIGPEAFLEVCNAYGLVKILDIREFAVGSLRALSDPPVTKATQIIHIHTDRAPHKQKGLKDKNAALSKSPKKALAPARLVHRNSEKSMSRNISEHSLSELASVDEATTETAASVETPFVAPRRQKPKPVQQPPQEMPVEIPKHQYNSDDSDDDMPSLAMIRAPSNAPPEGPLRIAGMGGVVVFGTGAAEQGHGHADVHNHVKQPAAQPKGRLHSTLKATTASFQPSLSPEGLVGASAFPVRGTKHAISAARVEKPLVLDDDCSDDGNGDQAAPVNLKIQGSQAGKALKITIPQQAAVASSRVAPVAAMPALKQAPSPLHQLADPVVLEAQLAGVRSIKVNEAVSKQSAQKMMEQLRAKRESRAQEKF